MYGKFCPIEMVCEISTERRSREHEVQVGDMRTLNMLGEGVRVHVHSTGKCTRGRM